MYWTPRIRGKESGLTFSQVVPYLRAGRLARRRGLGWLKEDQYGNYVFIEDNVCLRLTDTDRFADDWEIQ